MNYRVIYSPEAEAQLVALYFYISAAASPEIAAKYTEDIVRQCEDLATFPLRGTVREEIRPGLRTVGYKKRVTIAFDVTESQVTVHGIFYGGQNFEIALRD
jgi:plasmid stabilization system protein ParE